MARPRLPKPPSAIDATASRLRELARAAEPGALIGIEEALVTQLNVSRNTIRQAARLLERDGLLRVKRGISGGYFAARPDLNTVTETVSAYLDMTDVGSEGVTAVASTLWIAVLQMAARTKTEPVRVLAGRLRQRLIELTPEATFDEVYGIETDIRDAIFGLVENGRYIELIFHINVALGLRRPGTYHSSDLNDTAEHREFVLAWRNAKLMELDAITEGDQALAMMAARYSRNLWHRRLWAHGGAERTGGDQEIAALS